MRGKYNLITHQTLSLAATSHLVSGYLLHLLARIRKNVTEEWEQHWQSERQSILSIRSEFHGSYSPPLDIS